MIDLRAGVIDPFADVIDLRAGSIDVDGG